MLPISTVTKTYFTNTDGEIAKKGIIKSVGGRHALTTKCAFGRSGTTSTLVALTPLYYFSCEERLIIF